MICIYKESHLKTNFLNLPLYTHEEIQIIASETSIFYYDVLNHKASKSGRWDSHCVIPFATSVFDADIVSPSEVLSDHICPSLVRRTIVSHQPDLCRTVYYDV